MTEVRLSVILYKQGEAWLARALEHDILAQGDSAREALAELERVVQTYAAAQSDFTGFDKAAQTYWEMFDRGVPLSIVELQAGGSVSHARILAA